MRHGFAWLAVIAFVVAAPRASAGEGYQRPDPAWPHFRVPLDRPPNLRFHPDRERQQRPVVVLDATGLFKEGKLECRWPSGAFDATGPAILGMVLEPLPAPRSGDVQPQSCSGLPIVSTWGDLGIGSAVLYIEFVRHDDALIEARCVGKPCFLAISSLPHGWSEEPSVQVGERKRRATIAAERKRDPALDRFLDGSQDCLAKKDVPGCLAAFVSEEIRPVGVIMEWGDFGPTSHPTPPETGPGRARAAIEYIWSTDSRDLVEQCLRYAPAGALWKDVLAVRPPDSFLDCKVRKEGAEWRLFELGAWE